MPWCREPHVTNRPVDAQTNHTEMRGEIGSIINSGQTGQAAHLYLRLIFLNFSILKYTRTNDKMICLNIKYSAVIILGIHIHIHQPITSKAVDGPYFWRNLFWPGGILPEYHPQGTISIFGGGSEGHSKPPLRDFGFAGFYPARPEGRDLVCV
jgi:hypothetical protein